MNLRSTGSMMRKRYTATCIALIAFAAPWAASGDRTELVERYVWRAEYHRALSACDGLSQGERASCLTMTGDVAGASLLLTGDDDRFRRGLVAFKAGAYGEASRLLTGELDNPCLEGLRLYFRAQSSLRDSLFDTGAGELEKLFVLIRDHPFLKKHTMYAEAANLYAEALAHGGARTYQLRCGIETLSGRSLLLLSQSALGHGRSDEAARWYMRCTDVLRDSADSDLFATVTKELAHARSSFDREAILSAVDAAIRVGSEESASALIDLYIKRYPGDFDIRLRRADAAARFGQPKKALRIARGLFDSPAPVAVKRDALFRVASFEYRLDRRGRAAESYRLFGMYYPGDRRSIWALDTAARIELARRNRKRALTIWRVVRERRNGGRIALQAALSEAVLRYDCGKRESSKRILEGLLPATDGLLEAAVLYWLVRVEGETEQAGVWRARLFRTYPRSFYAAALRGDARQLFRAAAGCGGGTERIEYVEREAFEFLSSPLPSDSALVDHPAYGAFRYLLEQGLLEEAEAFGDLLRRLFGGEESVMLAVYHEARRQGLVRLSLETLNSASLCCAGDRIPPALFYPVAFTSVIAREAHARSLQPELILAVIREESKFDTRAVSRASARGLMQLMPSTGSWIGSKLGRKEVRGDDLFEPQFNIEAGTWYLAYLLERCSGSIPAALAAYNAGAAKTSEWRKSFRPAEKPMVAIELIGLRETREYVRRVLDTMFAYRSMLEAHQGLP